MLLLKFKTEQSTKYKSILMGIGLAVITLSIVGNETAKSKSMLLGFRELAVITLVSPGIFSSIINFYLIKQIQAHYSLFSSVANY